jgi:hypothetical protein
MSFAARPRLRVERNLIESGKCSGWDASRDLSVSRTLSRLDDLAFLISSFPFGVFQQLHALNLIQPH